MPKPRGLGKRAIAAKRQNSATVQVVLDDKKQTFLARVDKNLGPYFQLTYNDGKQTYETLLGSPRQVLSKIKITTGDIVVIEGLDNLADNMKRGKRIICEITGILSKSNVNELRKSGRIPKSILGHVGTEEDSGITFEESSEDESAVSEEGLSEKEAKRRAKKAAAEATLPKWSAKTVAPSSEVTHSAKEDDDKEVTIDDI
jgi:hypothetical protein